MNINLFLEHLTKRELYAAGITGTAVLLLSIWAVQLACFLYERISKKESYTWLKVLLTAVTAVSGCAYAVYAWLNLEIKAGNDAHRAMLSTEAVIVHTVDYGYFFDGWGSSNAMIFYGADLVEEKAYAPLLYKCAAQGIDCFLITMPYHRSWLDENAADAVRQNHHYYGWYMAAHGSGAQSAVRYVNAHCDEYDGLILFGAFPEEKLDERLSYIGIYAENDGLYETARYEQARKDFPDVKREAVIAGANHSGFAECGLLEYDREADISSSLQQQLAAEMVRLSLTGLN